MVDEILTGTALLTIVGLRGEAERARQQVSVDVRVVVGDLGDQLVDEVLMPLGCFENRHMNPVYFGGRR
jgi:hypothetical protein